MTRRNPISKTCAALAVAVAAVLLAASPAWAHTSRPDITSFAISGARPEATAGIIKLKIVARNAKTCTIAGPSSVIGTSWEGPCSSHAKIVRIWIAENLRESRATYRLRLIAHGKGGTSSRTLTITIPGEPPLATGAWTLTVSTTMLALNFEADGAITVTGLPGATGSWTYKHRTLKFDLKENTTTLEFEGTGPADGPINGTLKAGTEMIPFHLER